MLRRLFALGAVTGSLLCAGQAQAVLCPNPPCKVLVASVPERGDILPASILFGSDGDITGPISAELLAGPITFGSSAPTMIFQQIVIRTTFNQGLVVNSVVGPTFAGAVNPWSSPDIIAYEGEALILNWQPGGLTLGAPLAGAGFAIGSIQLDPAYLPNSEEFFRSTFTMQAFFTPTVVPEPGTIALVGGLAAVGGLLAHRRHRAR